MQLKINTYVTVNDMHVITAASRGDLSEFIERIDQFLDELGVFVRPDRLLAKLEEIAHA